MERVVRICEITGRMTVVAEKVDTETAKQAVANGANVLVAGSSLYSKENYKDAVSNLIKSAEGALSSVNY